MVDAKTIINNVKAIGSSTDQHKDSMTKKRAAFSGAMVGIVEGVIIGYSKKWNILVTAIGGGVIGGMITMMLSPND